MTVTWNVHAFCFHAEGGREFPVNSWEASSEEEVEEIVINCLRPIAGIDKIVVERMNGS